MKNKEFKNTNIENPNVKVNHDPLIDSLVVIARLFKRKVSVDTLCHGLPISDNKITVPLFHRAAERVGLSSKLVETNISSISSVSVLILKNKRACVLLSSNKQMKTARVILSGSDDGIKEIPISKLESNYTGYAFIIKEKFRHDNRSSMEEKRKGNHWFWGTIFSSWRIYRDTLVASVLINLFAIASPLFVMNVYDRVIPNNAMDTLWVLSFGVVIVFCFDAMLKMMRSYFIDVAAKKSDIILSSKLFAKVLGLPMLDRPTSVGAFASKLQSFESVRDFITSSTVTTLVDVPFSLLILLLMVMIGGSLAFIPITAMALILIYGLIVQYPLGRSIDHTSQASVQKNAMLIEALSGIESIRVSRAEEEQQAKWEKNIAHIAKWSARSKLLTTSTSVVTGLIQQMLTVAIILVGVYMVTSGALSMGGLIASVMLAGRCLAPMAQVTSLSMRYSQTRSALAELDSIMQKEMEVSDNKEYVSRETLQGGIEFKDVSFAYPDQGGSVLDNITLSIKPGEKVGIIGRSGSGKTTISRLLLGLYSPSSGSIRVDDVDLRQVSPTDLRRNIGTLQQESYLFYGSVRENIVLGAGHVEDSVLLGAAEIAGVMDFAKDHPEGLEMQVGERGSNISGGQKQCIALARALVNDPPIVLLDEPCTTLDVRSEWMVKNRLKKYLERKTLIMTTHKGTMLDLIDRLIVVDEGGIVADGPRDEVLAALNAKSKNK